MVTGETGKYGCKFKQTLSKIMPRLHREKGQESKTTASGVIFRRGC